ncbi:response regulator [Peredibacter starrii]|uniref:Response regulator n=1 Tax=Peredibacter starrii TaxID=28202 RepID=A0AAX4HLT4_9BACT|nr:response regulator [Peredibacter starrii]WPU64171.1 response regulator [Peredibacter starrii]
MKKILFIEEEKELQSVILKLFPKDQFRVIAAQDGVEGLQKCRNEEFDLIILDYQMPRLDGLRFYQQIRERGDDTPMLFTTAYVEEMKQKGLKWEKYEVVEKPYEASALLQKVNKLLGIGAPVKSDKLILNPGEILFDEGDEANSIYFIVSGVMKASKKISDGSYKELFQHGTGDLIGDTSVINGTPRILRVEAIEKTELVIIPSTKILSIVEGQPKWIKLMLESMSRRIDAGVKQIS